jgi:DNA-binding NarL/FixJ family response regulator
MNNRQVRVLLVEDHFLARVALHSVLETRGDITVIGEAGDGRTGLKLFQELMPDVTVMDLRLPQLNGFDTIAEIRALSKNAKIVVLSNYGGSEDIYRALRSGAMAYLSKATSGEELIQAILSVYRGIRYLPRSASDRLAERMPLVDLTPREREVLTCITRGLSNQDIADELRIAEKTVRVHVSSVLSKMGARDRTQAAVFAIQRGMVHLD